MRGGHPPRPPTATKKSVKPITHPQAPMAPHIRVPTPMGAMEIRCSPRTARLRTPSIRRVRKAPWDRCKLRTVGRRWPGQARTTVAQQLKPLMETSTRRLTAMPTRIPEVVGRKRVVRILPNLRDGGVRVRAAGHPPSEEGAAAGGDQGRTVPADGQAEEAVAAGAAA